MAGILSVRREGPGVASDGVLRFMRLARIGL
jgi:hypothetical protein